MGEPLTSGASILGLEVHRSAPVDLSPPSCSLPSVSSRLSLRSLRSPGRGAAPSSLLVGTPALACCVGTWDQWVALDASDVGHQILLRLWLSLRAAILELVMRWGRD